MRILADLHHADLYESLILLAERLGGELLRPKGFEWQEELIWGPNEPKPTAIQWLHDSHYPGLTLAECMDDPPDLVIISNISNFQGFKKFFSKNFPAVPVILQVGNTWGDWLPEFAGAEYVLNSTATAWPNAKAHARYHPEFKFERVAVPDPRKVVGLLHYPDNAYLKRFDELEKAMPSWDFKMHGAGTRGSAVSLAEAQDLHGWAGFLYQLKNIDDGHGFNLHRAWAMGNPCALNYSMYLSRHAGLNVIDGVTAYDCERPLKQVVGFLEKAADDYEGRSDEVARIWDINCNPEREWTETLKPFFESIL